jgi:hypothetical protein
MLAKLCARRPGPVVFDEAHALKEIDAERTKACLGQLARYATHAWFVSGTPAPNHAAELFPFLRVSGLWPGSWKDFVREHCTTKRDRYDPSGFKVTGTKDPRAVAALLAPAFIRRSIVEGRPPLSLDTIAIEGTDAYAQLAPDHVETIRAAIDTDDWSFSELEHVSTVRRLVGLAKVQGTIQLAKCEQEAGHSRLLIFGTHIDVLENIAAGIEGARVVNGKTSSRDAELITREFQEQRAGNQVIVGNMQTLGEGVTLTAASRVLIPEPSWVPKDNSQVVARAWRRGQTRPVHASFLSLAGSIDDAITRIVAKKTRGIEALLNS